MVVFPLESLYIRLRCLYCLGWIGVCSLLNILCAFCKSFEALNQRAVAVVVDPIQSVKGKVVIDAFRSINPQTIMLGQEPRQTTSNLGHLNKPSIQVMVHNSENVFFFFQRWNKVKG